MKRKGRAAATKKKTAVTEDPAMFEEEYLERHWSPSISTMEELKKLSKLGLLPAPEMEVWRPLPREHRFPQPSHGEFVLFEDFVMRGVGLPVHSFLRDLCMYWNISLCHLDPNSILTIAIFVGFCEMFLGIPPHFNLFRHFYILRTKGAGSGGSEIAGGCYVRLRDGMKAQWIDIPHGTPAKDWNKKWFYAAQDLQTPPIPSDVVYAPQKNDNWEAENSRDDKLQVQELLQLIDTTKVSGPYVAAAWLTRRVQPLKERVRPMFEYIREGDPTREPHAPKGPMSGPMATNWIKVFFTQQYRATYPLAPQDPYNVGNVPPPVSDNCSVICY